MDGRTMRIVGIDYAWGQFDSLRQIDPSKAKLRGRLEHPDIPKELIEALLEERILELDGDFGGPALGEPIEVDLLALETTEGVIRIRIFNRGIALFLGGNDQLLRLHRFLSLLRRQLTGDG
jgi:hypothetical protein